MERTVEGFNMLWLYDIDSSELAFGRRLVETIRITFLATCILHTGVVFSVFHARNATKISFLVIA